MKAGNAFNSKADTYAVGNTDMCLTIGVRGGIRAILQAINNHRMEKGMIIR